MDNLITSYTDGNKMTVDQMLKDPRFIPNMILKSLEGAFIEDVIFRDGGTNDGVVAYREAASRYLNDDAQDVAEFAEIPVSDMNHGKLHSVIGVKRALAIRVSWEMRHFDRIDQLNAQITALQNTMIRDSVRSALGAFNAADIGTMSASKAWNQSGGDPIKDISDAIEKVQLAAPEGADDDDTFGYNPNVLLLPTSAWTAMKRNDLVQRLYVGNVADRNPLLSTTDQTYQGDTGFVYDGLHVLLSRWVPKNTAYVLESGVAGFRSDAQPLSFTPAYAEGGNQETGGPTQSWRVDAFRHGIRACDNPKAVVKITGVTA
ncbi:hypothetical protein [Corynebacterium pygosceleis]|uniref:phage major capsid protein n=1 Tax=Corynebacterium pygosceleis TaxID=2800406 RepID=UPI0020056636|nr:hypothetical protein [Corynebacterium pygosceleis]MCK7676373.1 hypothetical protein [Corynebacterium pygosceleis]